MKRGKTEKKKKGRGKKKEEVEWRGNIIERWPEREKNFLLL